MKEEFEKLAAAGKIQSKHIGPLVMLTESGFCSHRSWGFGKITTVDTASARFVIDFPNKNGHHMDLSFAADSLKAIPKDHIVARKIADVAALRQMAALHHLDLIKLVVQSFGGRATMEQIQQVLVPDVIQDDWKKWWETAKQEMKKDGHFQVPTKKSEPIIYQAQETSMPGRLMGEFRAAKGLKNRLSVTQEIARNLPDLPDKKSFVSEVAKLLNTEIQSHQRTQPAVALEAIFIRDELCADAGVEPEGLEVTAKVIWASDIKFGQVMEALPAAKQRRAVTSFKEANPGLWHEALVANLNSVSTKLASEFVHALTQGGKFSLLKEALARMISQHQASSELLLWLAKERSDDYANILGPEVFRAMMTAIERDQFNEKRSNKLRDFILSDQSLILELLETADQEVIKDVTRALQLSPSFDDMDKRSLLARIVKSYPVVQELISGDQKKEDNSIHVSWASLEKLKNEYHEMVHKKLPANREEIAIARSYGDLRENHEYKAAKEMQRFLMDRKAEMERNLANARGTDFANARTDVVSPGTKVMVTDLTTNQKDCFTILGAWDSEPEQQILSYLTPLAQALLNKKIGETAEFDMGGQKKSYRIESIELAKVPEKTEVAGASSTAG